MHRPGSSSGSNRHTDREPNLPGPAEYTLELRHAFNSSAWYAGGSPAVEPGQMVADLAPPTTVARMASTNQNCETGEQHQREATSAGESKVRIVARNSDGAIVSLRESITSILNGSSRPSEWTVATTPAHGDGLPS